MYGRTPTRSTRPPPHRVPTQPRPRPPHRPNDSRTKNATPCARGEGHHRPERARPGSDHVGGLCPTTRPVADRPSVPGRGVPDPDRRASRCPRAAGIPPLDHRRGRNRPRRRDRTRSRSIVQQSRYRRHGLAHHRVGCQSSSPRAETGGYGRWGVEDSNLCPLACRPATCGPEPSPTVHGTGPEQGRCSTPVQHRPARSRRVGCQPGCQERPRPGSRRALARVPLQPKRHASIVKTA